MAFKIWPPFGSGGGGGGSGTVTSIATTAPVSGGPITTTGTLSLAVTPANAGGAVALQAATPGTQQTGNSNLSGTGHFGDLDIGSSAFPASMLAGDNQFGIMLGYSTVLPTNAAATDNIGIGTDAADAITTGHLNVAIGTNSGTAITTGSGNTLVGYNSGVGITTQNTNVALGSLALKGAGAGANVAIGANAMGTTTLSAGVAASNTGVGDTCFPALTTGSGNVAVGSDAGHGHATNDNCTYIGTGSKTTLGSVGGVVAVGMGASVAASGEICIGALGDGRPCLVSASGVPVNASHPDGSYYFRQDGAAATHIYFASGGTWSAII